MILLVIGVAIMILGVMGVIKDQRDKYRKGYSAVVLKCENVLDPKDGTPSSSAYRVTVQANTEYGLITKELIGGRFFTVGSKCSIFYNNQNDHAEFTREYRANGTKGSLVVMLIGFFICALTLGEYYEEVNSDGFPIMLLIFFCGFSLFSIYIVLNSVMLKRKREKEKAYSSIVCGTPVDVVEKSTKTNGRTHTLYFPVYKYTYDGSEHLIQSNRACSYEKAYDMSRRVNVVITRSGDVYCEED